MKEPNTNIDEQTFSQDDLLDGLVSGNYSHLKMFFPREPHDLKLPQDFLWVDRNNFGRITLKDIRCSGKTIIIDLQEYTTGIVRDIHVDINEEPDFQMVRWQDLIEMVKSERESTTNDYTLLEFEF